MTLDTQEVLRYLSIQRKNFMLINMPGNLYAEGFVDGLSMVIDWIETVEKTQGNRIAAQFEVENG